MTVQQAVLSAMDYAARDVVVDRNHGDLGRSLHHGVNEAWSNEYAKYDVHFERDGIPQSALELHDAVRADGGRGIVMVRGVERLAVPMDESQAHEASIRSYWWVAYRFRWKLNPGPNTLEIRTRNPFGELGPIVRANVTWKPPERP